MLMQFFDKSLTITRILDHSVKFNRLIKISPISCNHYLLTKYDIYVNPRMIIEVCLMKKSKPNKIDLINQMR